VQAAYLEAVLVQARQLTERCQWSAAERLLSPFVLPSGEPIGPAKECPVPVQAALLNLLGCCTCMTQDFDRAVQILGCAVRLSGDDPGLQQNLALAHELQNRLDLADTYWNRFLDLIERRHGIERARERAQQFTEKARSIISGFPESPYQRALCAVTDLVTDRDH
jgi:hypothetical protein